MDNHENDEFPPSNPETPSQRSRQISESSTSEDHKRRRTISSSLIPGVTDASPPKFVSLEEIMKAAKDMSNMALCHEIAVDKDFKIEKLELPENSLEKKVRDTMHQVFWDILTEQLNEDPPVYDHALVLLAEIKEELLSLLLPQHSKIKQEIDEILDLELIRQKVDNGALDFKYYAQYITSVMAKMCAPVRDEKIAELTRCEDVVTTFRGIFETLDLMKLDMANFTITVIRPEIIAHSAEYEREKFKEYLKLNQDGLDLTRKWLLSHNDPSAEGSNSKQDILTKAYLSIFEWDENELFPETLAMDEKRFLDLKAEFQRLVYTSTFSLVACSNVPILVNNVQFKTELIKHISILLADVKGDKEISETFPNVIEQILKNIQSALEKIAAPSLTEEFTKQLKEQLSTIEQPDHKIRLIVERRIKEFLQETISSATAAPVRVPPGLSSLQVPLTSLAGQYLRLVTHNRDVFGQFYTDILSAT
ncbi:hypothetical protein WDU94_011037 [Cyamophila willieti]